MKLNKLVIAMGLATAFLTACSDSNNATQPVTAIDGYIVNGIVTTTCGGFTYTGRTNAFGVAALNTSVFTLADCTSTTVTGDADTFDYDLGADVPWTQTMSTLDGLSVINPYTDIAALAVANDPTLDNAGALEAVYTILNIPASLIPAGTDLFVDFGTNNADYSEEQAKLAVLAETTFATLVDLKAAAPDATPAQLTNLYAQVLPQVSVAVDDYIEANPTLDLSEVAFTIDIPLPEAVEFNEDGTVIITSELKDIAIVVDDTVKPEPATTPDDTPDIPDATGGTGTGSDGVNQG